MKIYNGCPDNELRTRIEQEELLLKELRKVIPEASCCQFFSPDEGFRVHVWGDFIGELEPTRIEALQKALELCQK